MYTSPGARANLDRWASNDLHSNEGQVVRQNILDERFLNADGVAGLNNVLDGEPTVSISDLRHDYRTVCWQHPDKGGEVPASSRPTRLGRAVDLDTYHQKLTDANPGLLDPVARDLVDILAAGDDVPDGQRNLRMAGHFAWVCWCRPGDAFGFATTRTPERIRRFLNLNPDERELDEPLLLLEYQPLASDLLYRPTVANAALHLGFRVADTGVSDHGQTQPLRPAGASAADWPRQPEAVHEPFTMDRIVASGRTVI